MGYYPPKQSVNNNDTKYSPSSDAVYDYINQILVAQGVFPYYGSFYDTTTQTNPVANQINIMSYNTTSENYHVTIQNGNRITFEYPGVYNIQFSAQFEKTGGQSSKVDIWLRKNGTDVPWTNTEITLSGSSRIVASWNFVLSENANDYLQLCWSSPNNDVQILAQLPATNPTRPGIPSIILTVTPVKTA